MAAEKTDGIERVSTRANGSETERRGEQSCRHTPELSAHELRWAQTEESARSTGAGRAGAEQGKDKEKR